MGELIRALGALAEPPAPAHGPIAEALDLPPPPHASVHTELFLFQVYPYASIYLGAEGMLGGEARDRIAGFWRALGEEPPDEPDHVTTLLGLYAALCDRSEDATGARGLMWARSRHALLWEHLLSWLPAWAEAVAEVGAPFYAEWARLLRSALLAEADRVGGAETLPLHLREAPEVADPRVEGGRTFVSELLAPVRSGLIVTRDALARCGGELDLGLRKGERKYVLDSLLAQDPAPTLAWLAREARRQAARHRSAQPALGVVGRFWTGRARRTAELLADLAAQARAEEGGSDATSTAERRASAGGAGP